MQVGMKTGANTHNLLIRRMLRVALKKGKEVVVSSTSLSDDVSDSFATRIQKIMGPQDAAVGTNTGSSSAAKVRIVESVNQSLSLPPLQDVHKDVIATLAQEKSVEGLEIPSMNNDAGFRDFISKLVKSGSDKGFMHQKKYQKLMEPILEEQEQPIQDNQDGGSIDMVDYESSDSEEIF